MKMKEFSYRDGGRINHAYGCSGEFHAVFRHKLFYDNAETKDHTSGIALGTRIIGECNCKDPSIHDHRQGFIYDPTENFESDKEFDFDEDDQLLDSTLVEDNEWLNCHEIMNDWESELEET